jgi:dienelactone hydrolase
MRAPVGLFGLLPLLFSSESWAEPEDRGPLSIAEIDPGEILADGVMIPVKVHYPDAAGPYPIVLLMHGFVRTGRYHVELAQTLASRGIVVVLPDMPCTLSGCDHEANARQIHALLDWAVAESSGSGALAGKIDGARRGVLGHSWGGLGVFLASRAAGIQVAALLDPNDDQGTAAGDAALVTIPSIHIMATVPGACNATNWGDSVYPSTGNPRLRVRVVGAGHCDVEEPSDNFCPTICGRGDPSLSYLFRRYAVSFVGCVLTGDPQYAPYVGVGGAGLDTDVMANLIDNVDSSGIGTLPCQAASPTDAGVATDATAPIDANNDAGAIVPDAGVEADAEPSADVGPAIDATPTDNGAPAADAGTSGPPIDAGMSDSGAASPPIDESEDGCTTTSLPRSLATVMLALGAARLLRRRAGN